MRTKRRAQAVAILGVLALGLSACSASDSRADEVSDTEAWEIRSLDFIQLPTGGVEVSADRINDRAGGTDTAMSIIKFDDLKPSALQHWVENQKVVATDTKRRLPKQSIPEGGTIAGLEVKDGTYHCFASDRVNGKFATADTVEMIPFEDENGETYLFISRANGRWGCADDELEQLVAEAQRREAINQAWADAIERVIHSPFMCSFGLGTVGADAEDIYEVCYGTQAS